MTLSHIDNDDIFVNHEFCPISPKSNSLSPNEQKKQIDQDYLIALSMEEEEKKALANIPALNIDGYDELITINDEELARKLQEEEDKKGKQAFKTNKFRNMQVDTNRELNRYFNDRDFSPEDEESPVNNKMNRMIDRQQCRQTNLNVNQQFDDFRNNLNHRHHQQQHQQNYQKQEQESQNSQLDFQQKSEFERESTLRNNENLRNNKRSNSTENHTQSSSSRDRNSGHHSQNHGHHSKSSSKVRLF